MFHSTSHALLSHQNPSAPINPRRTIRSWNLSQNSRTMGVSILKMVIIAISIAIGSSRYCSTEDKVLCIAGAAVVGGAGVAGAWALAPVAIITKSATWVAAGGIKGWLGYGAIQTTVTTTASGTAAGATVAAGGGITAAAGLVYKACGCDNH